MKLRLWFLGVLLCLVLNCFSQSSSEIDSSLQKATSLPGHFLSRLQHKTETLSASVDQASEKYLTRLAKKEARFRQALAVKAPAAAARMASSDSLYRLFPDSVKRRNSSQSKGLSGEYLPYTDSLNGSLAFLQSHASSLNLSGSAAGKLTGSIQGLHATESKLQVAGQAKAYINQRRQMMKDLAMRYADQTGLKKYLDAYNKESFYYATQLNEYKQALNDPDQMLKKALVILNKIPAFQTFMKQYGQLAGLFGVPSDYGSAAGLAGLQTRAEVQGLLNGQIASGGASGMAAFQSNLQGAHEQLNHLKDKLSSLGQGSGDIDMPSFNPNHQKTKAFVARLEYGTDMQTTKANYFFPSTTDLGLSVGYKATDKITIGVGGSYKIGWGSDIRHIRVTNEGMSVRSYLDVKLKNTFYATGGFEYNYQQPSTAILHLPSVSDWTRSGLIGIGKEVKLPGKVVKKSKVALLWDFLSYSQLPKTQAFKFRVGYTF